MVAVSEVALEASLEEEASAAAAWAAADWEAAGWAVAGWAVADSEAVGWAEADLAAVAVETAVVLEAEDLVVQRAAEGSEAEAPAVGTEGAAVLVTVGLLGSVARFQDQSDHTESRPIGSWCTHSTR